MAKFQGKGVIAMEGLIIAFVLGLIVGIVGTGALAHNWPLMFVSPKKYFLKWERKIEKGLDRYEEEVKREIKGTLRKLILAINRIDLIK